MMEAAFTKMILLILLIKGKQSSKPTSILYFSQYMLSEKNPSD